MRKAKDEIRSQCKQSDFAKLERGKLYAEAAKGTSVVLLEPAIAKAFPTSEAVNKALHGLLELTQQTAQMTRHLSRRAK
jgi:hypothetical protein